MKQRDLYFWQLRKKFLCNGILVPRIGSVVDIFSLFFDFHYEYRDQWERITFDIVFFEVSIEAVISGILSAFFAERFFVSRQGLSEPILSEGGEGELPTDQNSRCEL